VNAFDCSPPSPQQNPRKVQGIFGNAFKSRGGKQTRIKTAKATVGAAAQFSSSASQKVPSNTDSFSHQQQQFCIWDSASSGQYHYAKARLSKLAQAKNLNVDQFSDSS